MYWFLILLIVQVFHTQVQASELRVSNAMITHVTYDPEKDGSRIGLSFSVRNAQGQPVNNLKSGRNGQFRVFIDGVQETSFETLSDNVVVRPPVGITLVLDTSYSMEDQRALSSMKKAAEKFESSLKNQNRGFNFSYYQFATEVQKMASLKNVSTKTASGQFTSLYSALKMAILENPNNVILLFTDGADNKSPDNRQMAVDGVGDIEKLISLHKTIIHTVKLGIEDSNDSKGVDNKDILRRVSVNGSLRYETEPSKLIEAFEAVASQVAYPYYFEYLCPRTRHGTYKILLQIDSDGVASDNSRWNADASFELPFEIGGGSNRPGVQGNLQPIKRPILAHNGMVAASTGRFMNVSSWLLGEWIEGQYPTQITGAPATNVSNYFVFLENVKIDSLKSKVSYDVVYEGDIQAMQYIQKILDENLGGWPYTTVYQYNIYPNGSYDFNILREFVPAGDGKKFAVTANGMNARFSRHLESDLLHKPGAFRWLQVVAHFPMTNREKFFCSPTGKSVFKLD